MWLYHVTPYHALSSIAERGLTPRGRSALSSTIPSAHLEGAVFLTEPDGVFFWYTRVEEAMFHVSDDPQEEGYTPVVLRTPTIECPEDDLGTKDAGGAIAYRCAVTIHPDELEYFDGEDWLPIDEWHDLDVDQSWDDDGYFLAEPPLLPDDEDLED